ncbi:MAG: YitT family protein, partial [Erysipelotrichaceae bacterium]
MWQTIKENRDIRNIFTLFCVLVSGFMQAAIIKMFMQPMNLLSSGFTGLAILIEKITSTFFGFTFSTSLGMLIL